MIDWAINIAHGIGSATINFFKVKGDVEEGIDPLIQEIDNLGNKLQSGVRQGTVVLGFIIIGVVFIYLKKWRLI